MRDRQPLKYDPVNQSKINSIINEYKDHPIFPYIMDLYKLIDYQKDIINKQEKQLISLKHIAAWKHYEKE